VRVGKRSPLFRTAGKYQYDNRALYGTYSPRFGGRQ
jgi:hypothetical protein